MRPKFMRPKFATAALAGAFLIGLSPSLRADAVIESTGGATDPIVGARNTNNCIPFSCDGYSTYQQVYSSSAFSGVTPINQLEFFCSTGSPLCSGDLDTGTYQIFLSYTSAPINGLSSVSPSANIGADETLIGTFSLTGGPTPLTLTFTGNTFTYNPTRGNLLMTINVSGAVNSAFSFLDADGTGSVTSRAYFTGITDGARGPLVLGQSAADSLGLVTGLNDVPEPSSLILVGTLMLGLIGRALWRKPMRRRSWGGPSFSSPQTL